MRIALPGGGWVVAGNRFDLVPERADEPPEVSVVIPYYDAQADLDRVLEGLAAQSHPAARLQIVVADDGSPSPPRVPPGVLLVSQPRAGFRAAAARNLGAAAAEGEVLCFLDGDTVPGPDYVSAASRLPAVLPDALVVGHRDHSPLPSPAWLAAGQADLLHADDLSYRYVISAVLTLRASLFAELAGFWEGFTTYGGEDWELAWRAWCAGAVLAHEPAAIAWHHGADWAGRGGSLAEKNAETLALAERIPLRRGAGLFWAQPEIVAVLPPASVAATTLMADSLLRTPGVAVWLPGGVGQPGPGDGRDPRVHSGAPPAGVLASCRAVVTVHQPCRVDLGRLLATTAGRVRVGPFLTLETSRALGRARRWRAALPGRDLVDELFGSETVDPADVGVVPLSAAPDLAAYFGGWG